MFNKTTVVKGSDTQVHNHTHTITEKKAPTDESLRLLDEFREEAQKSVIARGLLKCEHTDLEIAWLHQAFTMENPFDAIIHYRCKAGKCTVEGRVVLDGDESDSDIMDKVIEGTLKHLLDKVAFKEVGSMKAKGENPFKGVNR